MAPPIVEVNNVTVFSNNTISAGALFSAIDLDDLITRFYFQDFQSGANTGFFRVAGVAQANGAVFSVAADQLSTVEYVGGSQISFEGFRVVARDEFGNFSSPDAIGRINSVRSNTSRPHVRAPFFTALANEVIAGEEIAYGFDPDGHPMTHYEISEANRVLRSTAKNGVITVVSYDHKFTSGDTVTFQGANEGQFNRSGSINVVNKHVFRFAPAAGIADGEASGTLRAFNVDGGRFVLDGVELPQGQDFVITADQVQDLQYAGFGNSGEENIFVRGFDGVDWSTEKRGVASLVINANRPVVQFGNTSTPAEQLLPIEGTFPVTDADQNTMKYFWFFNTSPHSNKGDLIFKGAIMPRTTWFLVQAEDMDQLYFKTSLINDEQQIRVRAFDGKHLSIPGTLTIRSTPPLIRPEIEVNQPEMVIEQLQGVALSPLFSKTDVGPTHTNVQVFEPTTDPNSGTLRFNDTPLLGGVIHEFSKPVFNSNLNFYSGDFFVRNLDTVYVREQNDTGLWSSWEKIDIRTEPEFEDVLTSGLTWTGLMPTNLAGKLEISYSFMQQFPLYGSSGEAEDGDPAELKEFQVFNERQRVNARIAFRQIEEFANVQFVEVADSSTNVFGQTGGIIRMGEYGQDDDDSPSAYANFPNFGEEPGDMWFNRLRYLGGPVGPNMDFEQGTWGFKVFMHELGHAMGLKHPHDGSPRLPPTTDFNDFTVMSYQQPVNGGEPTTYQLYDVNELQDLYGANTQTRTGNDAYAIHGFWGGRLNAVETIWDAGGTDVLSAVGSPLNSVVDLRSGQFSSIGAIRNNIVIAFGADIENGIGSDNNDSVFGNGLDNFLMGRVGNDYLLGNAGNDYLVGGEGDDTFEWGVGDDNDIINEMALGGTDTLRISDFPTVDTLEEDFKFRLVGNDLWVDLNIDGGATDNSIRIVNQLSQQNRIETLELGGTRIDLSNLTSQVATNVDTFAVSADSSPAGQLVIPV